ncbi:MAG TPA: hypothetical protein VFT24_14095 [Vicinamibacterales bacterium]|nr:hypothetical protein [Vicinamibacterales bacterium]
MPAIAASRRTTSEISHVLGADVRPGLIHLTTNDEQHGRGRPRREPQREARGQAAGHAVGEDSEDLFDRRLRW